jgi:hypothetical protein
LFPPVFLRNRAKVRPGRRKHTRSPAQKDSEDDFLPLGVTPRLDICCRENLGSTFLPAD